MSNFTKVSARRKGEVRFGSKGHGIDTAVKTYMLPPEELAKYQNNERTDKKVTATANVKKPRRRIDLTVDEYVKLSMQQGLKDKDIAKMKGILPTSLANWKMLRREAIAEAMDAFDGNETKPIGNKTETSSNEKSLVVPRSDYEKALKEIEKLNVELNTEKQKRSEAFKKYEQSYKENQELRDLVKSLSQNNNTLDELNEFKSKLKYKNSQFEELKKEHETVIYDAEENEKRLNGVIDDLEKENKALQTKIERLEHSYKWYKEALRLSQKSSFEYEKENKALYQLVLILAEKQVGEAI